MSNLKPAPSSTIPKALKPDTGISLGLGLTNECNLKCAFCYRDPTHADRLSLQQVKSVIECLPVRSVNLGTGENGMHPDYKTILAYLRTRPVKLTITSNGHSVAVLEDHDLRASGCIRDDYRGHDEVKLLAAGGCRTSRETVWRSLACERLSGSAVRSLRAHIRRILARVP